MHILIYTETNILKEFVSQGILCISGAALFTVQNSQYNQHVQPSCGYWELMFHLNLINTDKFLYSKVIPPLSKRE
jgi:hypothetical protein